MAQQDLGHGPCLSDEEYQRRVIALQETMTEMPTKEQERENFRRQMELEIDYRLGTEFPKERRDALWAARERIDRRRWWLFLTYQVRRVFRHPDAEGRVLWDLYGLVSREFSKVLSPAELERFLELGRV